MRWCRSQIFHCVQIIINSDANKLVGAPLPLSCSVTSAALITVIAPQPLNFASEKRHAREKTATRTKRATADLDEEKYVPVAGETEKLSERDFSLETREMKGGSYRSNISLVLSMRILLIALAVSTPLALIEIFPQRQPSARERRQKRRTHTHILSTQAGKIFRHSRGRIVNVQSISIR